MPCWWFSLVETPVFTEVGDQTGCRIIVGCKTHDEALNFVAFGEAQRIADGGPSQVIVYSQGLCGSGSPSTAQPAASSPWWRAEVPQSQPRWSHTGLPVFLARILFRKQFDDILYKPPAPPSPTNRDAAGSIHWIGPSRGLKFCCWCFDIHSLKPSVRQSMCSPNNVRYRSPVGCAVIPRC